MSLPKTRDPDRLRARLLPSCLLAASVAWAGCAGDEIPEPIKIPAVSSLRSASDILIDEVETEDGVPEWIDRDRVADGFVYGIGIQAGSGRNPSEDLFLAMHAARRTVVVWLESRGAGAAAPPGLLPPLRLDPERIDFERIAHDTETDRWYALARLDVEREATNIEAAVRDLEQLASVSMSTVAGADASDDARVRAALSLVYDVDRRAQLAALYLALTGSDLAPGAGLDDATLLAAADEALADYGVRVVVDGPYVPGLHEAVSIAMGEVRLRADEFGRGLVVVRLNESDAFGPNNPYLETDGTVELSIDGEGRSHGTTFHVVSTGDSVEEARFRAARSINHDVAEIVRNTLRTLGSAETR